MDSQTNAGDDQIKNDSVDFTNKPFPMLDFERQMFTDIIDCDGLLITAKGLNESIVVQNILRAHNDPSNLVIVVNSSDAEEKYYMDLLKLKSLPNLITEREKTYLEGGVHFVSTRILVVDLLKSRVPVEHITGVIVLRAHTILESCQEAFALRLYRQSNKTGFIKAFSHTPQCFTFGFAHVEKVMKSLFLKDLFLWPRFHSLISQCLNPHPPTVMELHVPLSYKATLMQTCLLDIMNYTTKELKKINPTLDLQEITVENCITKNFHKILQSQLDCIWHQLSTRTKELVQDLRIMRNLLTNLIHHNAVSFYGLLSKYRTPEYAKVNSGWILLDSAEQLFKHAKNRVFNSKQEFEPEFSSKWKCITEILTVEIPADQKRLKNSERNIKILILCQDTKTCLQLKDYLTMGPQKCLYYSAIRDEVQIPLLSDLYKSFKSDADIQKSSETLKESEQTLVNDDNADEESEHKDNYILTMSQAIMDNITATSDKSTNADETCFESFTQMENMDLTQVDFGTPSVHIQTFKNLSDGICIENTLHVLKPSYVVMYHSEITATRQLELYEARRKDRNERPLTVYFLMHAQTTEEQAYLTSLRREKESFELLIQAKSTMVIPTYQDGKSEMASHMEITEPILETNTRKAGGQESGAVVPVKQIVIVDMREFRSDLPALLHKKGIHIDPVTITIGDYILTPDICVERKSLSDLIGSLNSGRLYTQCTQMCRNYARPMLLIEFDQSRPFQLQGQYMLSNDATPGADIRQKLQLLTLHFPRLKLVWSPSPYATAELFLELKQGRPQPSSSAAAALGEDASVDSLSIERYDPGIYDFMLKLPGVNSKNVARIMNKGISLNDIIKLSKTEIVDIVGNKNDGETLWSVFHNSYKVSESSGHSKNLPKNRFGKPMKGKYYNRK
ncbi:DNA repair endonuclease XPF-like [Arctopsyche grandis]|uniref:DNA repair endonuclease XPF-like n=1 Tax=Arctopsyche grandis TaxID=121162 RepID=UPI00406D8544